MIASFITFLILFFLTFNIPVKSVNTFDSLYI